MTRKEATVSRVWVTPTPAEMPIVVFHGRLAHVARQPWSYLVALPVLITVLFGATTLYAFVVPALRTERQITSMEAMAAAALPAGGHARVLGYTGGWTNRSAFAYADYRPAAAVLVRALGPARVPSGWRLISATCGGPTERCYLNPAGDLVLTVTFRPCGPPLCTGWGSQIDAVVSRQGPNAP